VSSQLDSKSLPVGPTPAIVRTLQVAGREMTFEFGKLARQANGSVLVRYGQTVVLVTATMSSTVREGVDFFPLTVDFEERLYAVGRIPGSWGRREGKPPEEAILAARLIDRAIRPLFPEGMRNDVQVIATVLSVDQDCSPEVCAMMGASLALALSDIPFAGPIGAVDVGLVDGGVILNPTREQAARSDLKLMVAGTAEAVVMVEAGAREVPEERILEAIATAHETIKELVRFQKDIVAEYGRPKAEVTLYLPDDDVDQAVRGLATEPLREAVRISDKQAREEAIRAVEESVRQQLAEQFAERDEEIGAVLRRILKEEFRRLVTQQGIRPDGRTAEEIRPISCEVGILPRTHGSALFTRGQTQVLSVVTLGAVGDVQFLDTISEEEYRRFMHHYNFPPFSVGETRPLRAPSRREVGHGALAGRAIEPLLPSETEFPYAIRVVSEVLESNGSTSMASVCASSMALMDAGVPLAAPVAGVAMGLIRQEDQIVILSDIQGMEDALGDMDFKVAGTERGITALQMDIKLEAGLEAEVLRRALEQARRGRLHILQKMKEAIAEPRKELSPYAPRILVMQIDPEKIRDVIGPGGKHINQIIAETDAKIDVEQDGRIYIAAADMERGEKAVKMIEALTRDVDVGGIYLGKVVRITSFGAFVEILPGKEGLIHISQLAEERVGRVEDVVQVGDEVLVKVTEIDRLGRINLSRKEALKSQRQQAAGGSESRSDSGRSWNRRGPRRPRR